MRPLACRLLLTAFLIFPTAVLAQERSPGKAEIESIVRNYLLEHPEILIEMSQKLQERQAAAKRNNAQTALTTRRQELFGGDDSMAVGAAANKPGVLTMVEFFDYRCGYCKRVVPVLKKLMAEDPNLRIVYKEFPILGPDSKKAAVAALAAQKQNRYLQYHEALMRSSDFSDAALESIAKETGLDVERWKKDMASPELQATIDRNHALAAALGIEATPAFVIGDEIVPGAMDESGFRALITKARQKSAN